MLHFNGLSYYVLPRLPDGYKAPDWLSIELGIFAGRLYINRASCMIGAQKASSQGMPLFEGILFAGREQQFSDWVAFFCAGLLKLLYAWLANLHHIVSSAILTQRCKWHKSIRQLPLLVANMPYITMIATTISN